MANAKEIRTKIGSIQSTQKITKAMEMVANSKMRRMQDRMAASRPYAEMMRKLIGHLALAHSGAKHPCLEERDVKHVGYLIIATDRGLCGGLNINLFKSVVSEMREWQLKGVESSVALVGSRGVSFFSSMQVDILSQVTGLGDEPTLSDLIGPVNSMINAYNEGKIDKLYIVTNKFINTMSQKPVVEQLLPLLPADDSELQATLWDYIYEPDAKSLMDIILNRYIESQVYQAVVENLASEQAARMVAMKAATDNGANLIKDLQIVYNKARQGAITNELIDIVSGAAAVSG